jgi:hypothetical protein
MWIQTDGSSIWKEATVRNLWHTRQATDIILGLEIIKVSNKKGNAHEDCQYDESFPHSVFPRYLKSNLIDAHLANSQSRAIYKKGSIHKNHDQCDNMIQIYDTTFRQERKTYNHGQGKELCCPTFQQKYNQRTKCRLIK